MLLKPKFKIGQKVTYKDDAHDYAYFKIKEIHTVKYKSRGQIKTKISYMVNIFDEIWDEKDLRKVK